MAGGGVRFTVIVPTRERADTLVHCLRTLVAQEYGNAEFIVSDNFSQDGTREVVESFNDPRIRYINTGRRISMSHNWEFALGHVSEGWVTILGDDDGLMPGALEKVAGVAATTGTRAIISAWCHYFWPDVSGLSRESVLPLGRGWETRNSAEWLHKLMKGEAVYPDLPMLYTGGFIDCELITRARSAEGVFYHSCTPDVYSAIALASVTETYVYLNEPVSVAGVSVHSNGASCLGMSRDKKPEQKFYSENNIPFHPLLGEEKIGTIPIAVYECYLQSGFLHHDSLKIDLADQLSRALSMAAPYQHEELRQYCLKVCQRNKLDMGGVEKAARGLTRKRLLAAIRRAPHMILPKLYRFDAYGMGARNVSDAALTARTLYVCLVHNRWWRFKRYMDYFIRLTRGAR